ncbi:lebercilin-like [Kryptolebias marmoratus]|uniref:lebercilin-like n=1 Tax=Kryptolebias marmoratus TaxID=37003 RepID=UPI0018ACE145|nr:lebercilin-like [Kryptolebias marmoratus]
MALKSQVWDLQQQLAEARTENKLLKTVQQRHMVALKHFQDSEDSVSQIVVKHNNEAKALQELLRQTRASRGNLSRQLQAAENKLRSTKAAVQHLQLQLLRQDHSLLERDKLVLKLDKASAQLEDKDRRIQDLDRRLELSQASFKRQLVAEQRKVREARKASCYLEEDVYQLTREVQVSLRTRLPPENTDIKLAERVEV